MSRRYAYALCLTITAAVLLTGCRGALGIFGSKKAKVDASKQALVDNREAQVREASKHVYATGLALDAETNRSPAVTTATDFNELAQVTLGPPDVSDVSMLKEMINGLLSTNASLRAAAEKQKKQLENREADLQAERQKLEGKLDRAEKQRDEAYEDAAKKAAIYEKWRARLYWIVGILGGGFLLSIILPALSTAFPVLAPFAAVFNGLFGTLTRTIFRIAPKAMQTAGVVGQATHQLSENTLRDLVIAIGKVKSKDPETFEKVLKPELRDATSLDSSRFKIDEIKERLKTLSPPTT